MENSQSLVFLPIHVKELFPSILCVQGKKKLFADLGLNNVCQM
jgi:hypothetical protein